MIYDFNESSHVYERSAWALIRDMMAGPEHVHARGDALLPRPGGMTVDDKAGDRAYRAYLRRAKSGFTDVCNRTASLWSGMVTRKPTIFSAPRLDRTVEYVGLMDFGTRALLAPLLHEALTVSFGAVVTDLPEEGGIPYHVLIRAEDIHSMRVSSDAGDPRVERVVIRETQQVDQRDVYRVLTMEPGEPYTMRRKFGSENGEDVEDPVVFPATVDRIPIRFFNAVDNRPIPGSSIMAPIAQRCLERYQLTAELRHVLYNSAHPTPVVTGVDDDWNSEGYLGSGTIWRLPEKANAFYLSAPSDGIDSHRQEIEACDRWMAILGARMIQDAAVRNEAAQTAMIRTSAETATLMTIIEVCEAVMRGALQDAAMLTGAPMSDGEAAGAVKVNTDLIDNPMTMAEIVQSVGVWQSGLMGDGETGQRAVLSLLQERDALPADFDPDAAVASREDGGDATRRLLAQAGAFGPVVPTVPAAGLLGGDAE